MACFQNQLLLFAKQNSVAIVSSTKLKTENAERSPEKRQMHHEMKKWKTKKIQFNYLYCRNSYYRKYPQTKFNSTTSIVEIAIIENTPKRSNSRLTINLLLYKKQRKWISAYLVSFLGPGTPANHWLVNTQLINWCCFFCFIRNSIATLLEVIIHVRQLYRVSYFVCQWFYDTSKLAYFSMGNQGTVPDCFPPIYNSGHDSEYKHSTMFLFWPISSVKSQKSKLFDFRPSLLCPLTGKAQCNPGVSPSRTK